MRMMRGEETAREPHIVPVVERAMELLGQLETERRGLRIGELVAACRVPRSTVYRILNTLERHEMVRREEDGRYRLGARLLRLAASLPADPRWADVVAVATPHLRALSRGEGETTKLSVLDGREALCVAGAQGSREFALGLAVGKRYPLHAGAASKVLLAAMPAAARARLTGSGLAAQTDRTVVDAQALERELDQVRREGVAEDRGEYDLNVGALAAPVRWAGGEVVAALSIAFIAGPDPQRKARLRAAVVASAGQISAELGSDRPAD